jgi:hypothetical protein
VKDCAAKDASCDFYVKVTILGNEIQINQDFSVNYNGQRYSRNQVIYWLINFAALSNAYMPLLPYRLNRS